jgi:hypothetical protein
MVALPEPVRDREADTFVEVQTEHQLLLMMSSMYKMTRKSILNKKRAFGRGVNGRVTDNHFGEKISPNGRRRMEATQGQLIIEKRLSEDFNLVFKQSGIFTFFLKELAKSFPIYAVIRNPLSILVSWNTIDFPLAIGHHRHIEILNPLLREKLESQPDILDRQITLLSWFYDQYFKTLPNERILCYEDIIATKGKCLEVIVPSARQLNGTLEARNVWKTGRRQKVHDIGHRLLQNDGAFWHFYTKESIINTINREAVLH